MGCTMSFLIYTIRMAILSFSCWICSLIAEVFNWAFAYNNKQIYKVNSDGTRGDLLLDIGGREGIEANAAASEYHEYATTHFTQALKADTIAIRSDERLCAAYCGAYPC